MLFYLITAISARRKFFDGCAEIVRKVKKFYLSELELSHTDKTSFVVWSFWKNINNIRQLQVNP